MLSYDDKHHFPVVLGGGNFLMKVKHVVFLYLILGGCTVGTDQKIYQEEYSGEISGYEYDEYQLQLSENDQLTANIDVDKLDVIIYSPTSTVLENDKPITINTSGNYILRVLMPSRLSRIQP